MFLTLIHIRRKGERGEGRDGDRGRGVKGMRSGEMRIGTGDLAAEHPFVRAEGSGGTGHARIFPFGTKNSPQILRVCVFIVTLLAQLSRGMV